MVRIAQFLSGIPPKVPIMTVSRFCGSGLEACSIVANSIRAGDIDVGLAGGGESFSTYTRQTIVQMYNPKVLSNDHAMQCVLLPGRAVDNITEVYGYTREMQDAIALESHRKAAAAQRNGAFKDEMVPVMTRVQDKLGNEKEILVDTDGCVRPDLTMEQLGKLQPSHIYGTTTAGNNTRFHDGAAAVLLARRSAAKKYNLPVLGVYHGCAVSSVEPLTAPQASSIAISALLKKRGLTVDDIDIFEINDVGLFCCMEDLKLPTSKVNVNGGTFALGHPWGCTGSRMVATALHELKRRGKRAYALVATAANAGMGMAGLIEYPGPTA